MASVDSGVETENDSNDSSSNTPENRRSVEQSVASNSTLRDSRSASENSFFSGRDPMPSTSQGSSNHPSPDKSFNENVLNLTQEQASAFNNSMVDEISNECKQPTFGLAALSSESSTSKPVACNPNIYLAPNKSEDSIDDEEIDESSSSEGSQGMNVDAPAGLSFQYLKPVNGNHGYSLDIRPNARADGHNRCKAERVYKNQSRHARHALIEPLTVYYERNLRRAVSTNNTQTVAVLLNSGVSPNAADEFKRAPLHLAACRGYIQILQLLLAKGANPNQKDAMGNTALHLAACTNNVPVVTLLLKAGTDVCSLDQYGRNPLQLAQTRLKMLQATAASNPDAMQVKLEVQNVIDMMQIYLHRIGSENKQAENELLSSFSSRLTLSQTSKEVDHELRGLLASLSCLNIGKTVSNTFNT